MVCAAQEIGRAILCGVALHADAEVLGTHRRAVLVRLARRFDDALVGETSFACSAVGFHCAVNAVSNSSIAHLPRWLTGHRRGAWSPFHAGTGATDGVGNLAVGIGKAFRARE